MTLSRTMDRTLSSRARQVRGLFPCDAKHDVLDSLLPGLGRDWTEIIASLSTVYYRKCNTGAFADTAPGVEQQPDTTTEDGTGDCASDQVAPTASTGPRLSDRPL